MTKTREKLWSCLVLFVEIHNTQRRKKKLFPIYLFHLSQFKIPIDGISFAQFVFLFSFCFVATCNISLLLFVAVGWVVRESCAKERLVPETVILEFSPKECWHRLFYSSLQISPLKFPLNWFPLTNIRLTRTRKLVIQFPFQLGINFQPNLFLQYSKKQSLVLVRYST